MWPSSSRGGTRQIITTISSFSFVVGKGKPILFNKTVWGATTQPPVLLHFVRRRIVPGNRIAKISTPDMPAEIVDTRYYSRELHPYDWYKKTNTEVRVWLE
jgi:hypothetical protein